MGQPVQPVWKQDSYAFHEDGTESGSTIIGSAGSQQTINVDTIFFCRLLVKETAGTNQDPSLTIKWQYSTNAGGAWSDVSTTTPVQFTSSGNVATDDTTTQRIGAGSFIAGQVQEGADTTSTAGTFNGNDETEFLAVLTIDAAQVVDADEILVRAVESDGTVFAGTYVNADIDVNEGTSVTVEVAGETATSAITSVTVTAEANVTVAVTGEAAISSIGSVTAVGTPYIEQASFRARNDDGSESAATWKALANTNWTQSVDVNFRIRHVMKNTGWARFWHDASTRLFMTQYSVNAGTWTNIGGQGTSALAVVVAASDHVVNEAPTTQQLGSGTFEDGTFTDLYRETSTDDISDATGGLHDGKETEVEQCLEIIGANVSDGDTIELRLVSKVGLAALDLYTNTPSITVDSTVSVTATPDGEVAAASHGDVSVNYGSAFDVVGIALTSLYGTVSVIQGSGVNVSAVGQGASADDGSVTVSTPSGTDVQVDVTGEAAVAAQGDVVATGYLAGWGRCKWNKGAWGTPTPCGDFTAVGQTAVTSISNVSITADRNIIVTVAGQGATSGLGDVVASGGTGIDVAAVGQSAIADDGAVSVLEGTGVVVNATGIAAAATFGDETVITSASIDVQAVGIGATASFGAVAVFIGGISTSGWSRCTWSSGEWGEACFSLYAEGQGASAWVGEATVLAIKNVTVEAVGQTAGALFEPVVVFDGNVGVLVTGIGAVASWGDDVRVNYDHLIGLCGDIGSYAIGERAIADTCYDLPIERAFSDTCIDSLTIIRTIESLTDPEPEYSVDELPPNTRSIESLTIERSIMQDESCKCS